MRPQIRLTAIRCALLFASLCLTMATRTYSLTVEDPLTVDYVREHPDEWSVKVERGENGLIKFTVVRNLNRHFPFRRSLEPIQVRCDHAVPRLAPGC